MRFILLISIILFAIPLNIISQGNSQNIVTTLDEAQKKFTGRRNLTYEYLQNKNYKEISDILDNPLVLRLTNGYEENLQSFYKEEITLILYWLGDYKSILKTLIDDSYSKGSIIETGKEQQSIIPYKNSFYSDILELCYKNQKELKEKIKSSNLEPQEIDFLILYLDFRLSETQLETFNKDSLINRAKKYETAHPNAEYIGYIQSNIDIDYKTSNFGIGSTLFIGGYMFTENLGKNMTGGMPIGGIINVAYKNIIFDFQFTGSLLNKVKQEFEYEETWEKDTRTTLAFGSLNIGYSLINNQKMMLTPSFGLASTHISSYIRKEESEINLKIDNIPVLHTSLTFDYRIKHTNHITEYRDRLISEFDKTYWVIRLKTGFIMPNFEDANKVFKGNIFYIGAGIGIFTYPATSIKQK